MQVKYKLTVFLCCLFTAFQTNANGKEVGRLCRLFHRNFQFTLDARPLCTNAVWYGTNRPG